MTFRLEMKDNLPFVKMKVKYRNKEKSLIDTGSASSILKGELVKEIGINLNLKILLVV